VAVSGSHRDSIYDDLTGRTARLMLYGLLAVTLMALDHRGQWLDSIRQTATGMIEPVYHLVDLPFTASSWLRDHFASRREVNTRLAELEWERLITQTRLNRMAELEAENTELRAMLDARERADAEYIPASLLRVQLDPHSHRILVNRGRVHGVENRQAVVDSGGVLGQVTTVYRNSAEITLISDPNHAIPVTIHRTGVRTIAYGNGSTKNLSLPDLPANADIEPGDQILTSGLDGLFPAGLPVGEVISVQTDAGRAFAEARARPLARIDRSRHVLLLDTRAEPDSEAARDFEEPPPEAEQPMSPPAAAPEAIEPDEEDPTLNDDNDSTVDTP